MDSTNYEVGDIVYLKIGGPTLVIDNMDNLFCHCLYICKEEIKSVSVSCEALTKEKPVIS